MPFALDEGCVVDRGIHEAVSEDLERYRGDWILCAWAVPTRLASEVAADVPRGPLPNTF
jgi:hypothetical protein